MFTRYDNGDGDGDGDGDGNEDDDNGNDDDDGKKVWGHSTLVGGAFAVIWSIQDVH